MCVVILGEVHSSRLLTEAYFLKNPLGSEKGGEVGQRLEKICGKCTTLPSCGIKRELLTTSILRVTKLFLILLNNHLDARIKQTV